MIFEAFPDHRQTNTDLRAYRDNHWHNRGHSFPFLKRRGLYSAYRDQQSTAAVPAVNARRLTDVLHLRLVRQTAGSVNFHNNNNASQAVLEKNSYIVVFLLWTQPCSIVFGMK